MSDSPTTDLPSTTTNGDEAVAKTNVTIYGTSWCVWCPRVKALFDKLEIPYAYHDIEEDSSARAEVEAKLDGPVQGVPVLDVHGEIIYGYDVPKIEAALAKN